MTGMLHSQSFSYLHVTDSDDNAVDIFTLPDSSYQMICFATANNNSIFSPYAVHLNKQGIYMGVKSLEDTSLSNYYMLKFVPIDVNNFYAIASVSKKEISYNSVDIMLIKYDANLDTLWTKIYKTNDTTEYVTNAVLNPTNKELILSGFYYKGINQASGPIPYFMLLDSMGAVINKFYEDTFGYTCSIGYDYNNKIILGATLFYPNLQTHKYSFNSNLNSFDTCSIFETGLNASFLCLQSNKFISTYDQYHWQWNSTSLRISLTDSNCNIFKTAELGQSGIDERMALFHGLDSVSKNRIIIAGTSNFDYGFAYFSNHQGQFHCAVLDDSLNIIWEKNAGDFAYHFLYRAMPTYDGGVIAVGSRYDYIKNFPPVSRDPIVMKFDSLGNIQGSYDNNNQYQSMFNVYPNPASDILNIEALDNLEYDYEVYNITGDRLMQGELKSHTKINILKFSSGVYYLKIVSKKGSSFKKFLVTH